MYSFLNLCNSFYFMLIYTLVITMLSKLKTNKYQILELIIIFIITLLFDLLCNNFVYDEIWNYGFSYNIATGLIPYKDFNMIITPLFPILGSIWMLIFEKSFLSYYIFNTIICTVIFSYIKKFNSKSYYIVYSILLLFSLPNYNLFCMLLLYILMTMEDKNSNDYLIGIILGITFLTKQSIGIFLCIPTIFIKDIKKIFKRFIGFIIPIIFLMIYLIYNNIVYEFIDYTILGISNFANKNFNYYWSCLIFLVISIIYLIYQYIKNKDIKLLYLLSFQIVAYPIIDLYHVMIPFIPTLTYFLKKIELNKKIISCSFTFFIITIFSYNIYLCTNNNYSYPNNTKIYKYKKINNNTVNSINIVKEYIENNEERTFIIDMCAYLIKLETSIPIDKYDLLNDGNLGRNGETKIIKEIDETCQKEKCTFLLNENEIDNRISQYNQEILKYINKSYQRKTKIGDITIYKNY